MNNSKQMAPILQKAKTQCQQLIQMSQCYFFPFHNWEHTAEVYDQVHIIGMYERFTKEELELICLAALFHDTGNANGFEEHEKISSKNALLFLEKHQYDRKNMELIIGCIMATQIPQVPNNKYQKVLCDADLFHIGSNTFFWKNKLLRKEWEKYKNQNFSDADWYRLNIDFLEEHNYHTEYGKKFLQPVKQRNISLLKSQLVQEHS